MIGASMTALDTTIVNVARDTLHKEFDSSATAVSWVWSAYSIVFAAVLLTSGRLADRYGRRRIYTIGLLVFISASALCGAAPTLAWLIGARMVQAVGGALLVPAALALLLPEYPPEKRSTVLGLAYFAPAEPAYWTHFAPFLVMLGAAIGTLIVGLQSASVRYVPSNRLGMASAFNTTLRQVGAALWPSPYPSQR